MRIGYIACAVLVLIGTRLQVIQGIKCWVCDGKTSLKACHAQYGRLQECSQPDHVCQNDYRTVRGKPLIIKGCKQEKACETEVRQNAQNNQCGRVRSKKNLVCRCCCSTSGCNSKESGCLPPPAPCKRIQRLQNGRVHCPSGEIEFGSQCFFSCSNGYQLVGKKRAICRPLSKGSKKGKWDPEELPVCEKIIVRCEPPRVAPENGFIQCTNSREYSKFEGFNYAGSTCKYSCEHNYYVDGKKISQCQMDGKWNNPAPGCTRGSCKAGMADPNRITECTEGNLFGSSCVFECKSGYTLIGSKKSACAQMGEGQEGLWTKRFPRCSKVICRPEITEIQNGEVSCTDENFDGSVCSFTCNDGFDMDDTTESTKEITCVDDGNGDTNGVWTGQPPSCSPITCKPSHSNPQHGHVLCSDKNNFGSVCSFTCDEGFDMDGTEELEINSTCKDDGSGDRLGEWSTDAPKCSAITCNPLAKHPENGLVRCTDRNYLGSECSYECKEDYDLTGSEDLVVTRKCTTGKKGTPEGEWSGPPPECTTIRCPQLPFMQDGMRICSMGMTSYSGSFCLMWCFDGYDMKGISYITCRNAKKDGDLIGDWSDPPPVCELSMCEPPKYDKTTVVRKCTAPEGYAIDEYRVGTVCEYKCINEGYYMVPNKGDEPVMAGFIEDECTTDKKWSNLPPRCFKKTCLPPITSLPNGYTPKCTDGNTFGSKCQFQCLAKHGLTHENPLVCQADGDNDQYGKWSHEIPSCVRNECDEFGTINNGKLTCSNGVKVGSVCDLTCIDRYVQKRYERVTCMPNAEWDQEKYVCCVKCLFNRRLNILTMFDSTAFDTKEEFQFIVDFLDRVVSVMINYRLDIQISAIRYADDVDTDSFVDKARLRTKTDLEEVTKQINDMPITGQVSNTGNALKYANEVFFATKDRRREEFVLLVTTGNSEDRVAEQAQSLRDKGINILVVGYKVNQSARKNLMDIAGQERNLVSAITSRDLAALSEKISVILMTTGCTAASKSQQCS